MAMAHSNAFRGSAAFFAMLLSASSGAAMDAPAVGNAASDQASPAVPQAQAGRAHAANAGSKFARRRLTLADRLNGRACGYA